MTCLGEFDPVAKTDVRFAKVWSDNVRNDPGMACAAQSRGCW